MSKKKKITKKVERKFNIYLSGPMSHVEDWNFPLFNRVAKMFRDAKYTVFNPAETFFKDDPGTPDSPKKKVHEEYLRYDIQRVAECESIVLLPNWRNSSGARGEVFVAKLIGMGVFEWVSGTKLRVLDETICQEADRLVGGARAKSYGHPFDDFTRTGKLWRAILGAPGDIPPERVAMCMIAVKLSRQINSPKRDNLVDICGYSRTIAMVEEKKNEHRKNKTSRS